MGRSTWWPGLVSVALLLALPVCGLGAAWWLNRPAAASEPTAPCIYQIKTFYADSFVGESNLKALEKKLNDWFTENPRVEFLSLSQHHGMYDSVMLTLAYRQSPFGLSYRAELFYCDVASPTKRREYEDKINRWLAERGEFNWVNRAEASDGNGHVLTVVVYTQ